MRLCRVVLKMKIRVPRARTGRTKQRSRVQIPRVIHVLKGHCTRYPGNPIVPKQNLKDHIHESRVQRPATFPNSNRGPEYPTALSGTRHPKAGASRVQVTDGNDP